MRTEKKEASLDCITSISGGFHAHPSLRSPRQGTSFEAPVAASHRHSPWRSHDARPSRALWAALLKADAHGDAWRAFTAPEAGAPPGLRRTEPERSVVEPRLQASFCTSPEGSGVQSGWGAAALRPSRAGTPLRSPECPQVRPCARVGLRSDLPR